MVAVTDEHVLPQLQDPKRARAAGQVVERFLRLMTEAAADSSATLEQLVAPLLTVCVERIVPHLASPQADRAATVDVHCALLRLFQALLCHPRLFAGAHDPSRLMQLRYMLGAFVQALTPTTELTVYRTAAELLPRVSPALLGAVEGFHAQAVAQVLLTLLRKTHDTARDDLISLLRFLAEADAFQSFYRTVCFLLPVDSLCSR